MLLLLQHQDNVSWFNVWCLVGLPREGDLLAVLHAFVYMHLQKLVLLAHLLAFALLTAVLFINQLPYTRRGEDNVRVYSACQCNLNLNSPSINSFRNN